MPNVLIVEKTTDTSDALAKFLERLGHVVTCAPNGTDALLVLMRSEPDVIILDLLLPDMDGPSFLEVVRNYLRCQTCRLLC